MAAIVSVDVLQHPPIIIPGGGPVTYPFSVPSCHSSLTTSMVDLIILANSFGRFVPEPAIQVA